jgi:hypothetical protein
MYLGDFAAGATIDFKWNTVSLSSGSITRSTDGSIRIYKTNSATQRTSSAGITDTEDFDSLTGVHHCRIDLSDNTDAGFYAAGNDYQVVIQGAVIGGLTINAALAHFSIANRPVQGLAASVITATSIAGDAITAAKIADGAIDAATFAAGAITAASIAADAITDAKVASDVTIASVTGAVGSVTGSVGSIAAGGIASASFAAGAIDASAIATDAIGALELAAGAASEIATAVRTELTTELGRIDVAVSTRLATAGYTAPDNTSIAAILVDTAEIGAAGAGLTALATQASVNTIDDFLDTEVAAILAAVDTEVAAIKAKTDNLPAAPAATGDIPTAGAIADAVHDEVVDGTLTFREATRLQDSALFGKLSGAATTSIAIRDAADTKDRITATVDTDGNRTAVTLDGA